MQTVSRQAIWYTAVFLNGIFASMFSSRLEAAVAGGVIDGGAPSNETLADHVVLAVFVSLDLFLCPLQGLFNVIIYLRPSFLLWRDAHPNKGRIWELRQIVHGKKVTVTRRRSHLVDGNVNEETKCHDDTITPTLRTYDNDSRSQGVRCSGNSSSRRTDGSLAMMDRWKLEDDHDDEEKIHKIKIRPKKIMIRAKKIEKMMMIWNHHDDHHRRHCSKRQLLLLLHPTTIMTPTPTTLTSLLT
jgi:hypothetical protein